MREIKFRRFEKGTMYDNVEVHELCGLNEQLEQYNKENIVLMASLGMCEKDNIELYEGDIICHFEDINIYGPFARCGVVVYDPTQGYYQGVDLRDYTCDNLNGEMLNVPGYTFFPITDFVVIGNIYENPELLS